MPHLPHFFLTNDVKLLAHTWSVTLESHTGGPGAWEPGSFTDRGGGGAISHVGSLGVGGCHRQGVTHSRSTSTARKKIKKLSIALQKQENKLEKSQRQTLRTTFAVQNSGRFHVTGEVCRRNINIVCSIIR